VRGLKVVIVAPSDGSDVTEDMLTEVHLWVGEFAWGALKGQPYLSLEGEVSGQNKRLLSLSCRPGSESLMADNLLMLVNDLRRKAGRSVLVNKE